MITRSTSLSLEAGDHVLVFPDLPSEIDRNSIQARGAGEGVLGECVYETEYFAEDTDARKRLLLRKQQKLEDDIADVQLVLKACDKEKEFVDRIAAFVTTPAPQGSERGAPADPFLEASAWSGMLSFYQGKHAEIDAKRIRAERSLRDLSRELQRLNSELDSLGQGSRRSRNVVKVGVHKENKGELALDLSYLLDGPSWRPVYNVRASSEGDVIAVEYGAVASQATGEDWEGVDLRLSTARVDVSGVLPILEPWRLRRHRPLPLRSMAMKNEVMDLESAKEDSAPMASKLSYDGMDDESSMNELEYGQADVESSGPSVVFNVRGGGSVGGDNGETFVSVMRWEFPAKYAYSAVPKMSEYAYLTASMENTSEFPMLPGKANVFLNGSFVSASGVSLIMPGQKFEISLGIDEGVKVEYRFLKRFRKNEGLMSKRVTEEFEYQIRATNNRKKPIAMKIFDQFPIAEDKEISVKPVSPAPKGGQKEVTIDDEMKIQWEFKLPPGQKRELPYGFVLEYPVGGEPAGL